MTMALEGGEGSASRPGHSLPPGKTWYPLYRKLSGPQGRSGQVRKILPPPGFDPQTVQSIASRYTDWVTRPTTITMLPVNIRLVYKKHLAKLLISTVSFKLLNICNLSFFQATYYVILCSYLQNFYIKMWYNLRHGGHDCLLYHVYVHTNHI
jgi:hypothetical protein